MDSSCIMQITKAFNKFIKEVFHSSTLDLKVKEIGSNQVTIFATGYSNRLLASIKNQYGEVFVNELVYDIAVSNMKIFLDYLEEATGRKFEFVSLKGGFGSHLLTLRQIPLNQS